MKRIILALVILLAITAIFLWWPFDTTREELTEFSTNSKTLTVSIASEIEIQPIVELRNGFKRILDEYAVTKGISINYRELNANGDSSLIAQIADSVATNPSDVVYVLGTRQAQAIQKRAPKLLMVQGAVTDPVSAKLADSWQAPGRPYLATSDLPPVDKQLNLIKTLIPDVRTLGVIYNPGETNSNAVLSRLKAAIAGSGMSLVERPVSNTAGVAEAMDSLIGNVQSLYLPPDNTIYGALDVVGQKAKDGNIALFATTKSALKSDALASLALDFDELGESSAKLLIGALEGTLNPTQTPISYSQNPPIYVNQHRAKILSIDLDSIKNWDNLSILDPTEIIE